MNLFNREWYLSSLMYVLFPASVHVALSVVMILALHNIFYLSFFPRGFGAGGMKAKD